MAARRKVRLGSQAKDWRMISHLLAGHYLLYPTRAGTGDREFMGIWAKP